MKFKITKIGTFNGKAKATGKDYTILTFQTEDGKKLKAFGNATTLGYKEGQEIDVETEVKKDREGFDEVWIKSSGGGRSFTRNVWPEAYALAIDYLRLIKMQPTEELLDTWAKHFHAKISGNINVEKPKPAPTKKPADEASDDDEINVEDTPF